MLSTHICYVHPQVYLHITIQIKQPVTEHQDKVYIYIYVYIVVYKFYYLILH